MSLILSFKFLNPLSLIHEFKFPSGLSSNWNRNHSVVQQHLEFKLLDPLIGLSFDLQLPLLFNNILHYTMYKFRQASLLAVPGVLYVRTTLNRLLHRRLRWSDLGSCLNMLSILKINQIVLTLRFICIKHN